jgi:hypothetical protein
MKRRDSAVGIEQPSASSLEHSTTILAEVSRELGAWVPILRRLAEAEAIRGRALDHSFEITSAAVRSMMAARSLRDDYFWPTMNENAWSVLLELFACRLEGRRLDMVGLSDATGLTSDIALHWADWLAGRGMVALKLIEGDASLVDLTDSGADSMRAYLLASLSLSPWVN